MTKEIATIMKGARKNVPADPGVLTINQAVIDSSFLTTRPDLDYSTAEGKRYFKLHWQVSRG